MDNLPKNQFRIDLTLKGENALARMVEVELVEERKPTVVAEDDNKLRCPICGKVEWNSIWTCRECGQIYHSWDIDFIRANSPATRCANRFCPSRKRNISLLQTARPLE